MKITTLLEVIPWSAFKNNERNFIIAEILLSGLIYLNIGEINSIQQFILIGLRTRIYGFHLF